VRAHGARAELQDLDGVQVLGSRGEGGGVEYVGGVTAGLNADAREVGDGSFEVLGAAGQQRDLVAGGTEAAGTGEPEPRPAPTRANVVTVCVLRRDEEAAERRRAARRTALEFTA
jgi:hypothetical protein